MKCDYRWSVVVLILASLLLQGCREKEAVAGEEVKPATVEHLDGVDPSRVTLTEEALKRLDIQTEVVREQQIEGGTRKVIPYAAVLYDTDGSTWIYINSAPLVYLRHPVVVERVTDDLAVLSEGPPIGTEVVTVGGAELYGSESEFEEE